MMSVLLPVFCLLFCHHISQLDFQPLSVGRDTFTTGLSAEADSGSVESSHEEIVCITMIPIFHLSVHHLDVPTQYIFHHILLPACSSHYTRIPDKTHSSVFWTNHLHAFHHPVSPGTSFMGNTPNEPKIVCWESNRIFVVSDIYTSTSSISAYEFIESLDKFDACMYSLIL